MEKCSHYDSLTKFIYRVQRRTKETSVESHGEDLDSDQESLSGLSPSKDSHGNNKSFQSSSKMALNDQREFQVINLSTLKKSKLFKKNNQKFINMRIFLSRHY